MIVFSVKLEPFLFIIFCGMKIVQERYATDDRAWIGVDRSHQNEIWKKSVQYSHILVFFVVLVIEAFDSVYVLNCELFEIFGD